MTRRRQLLQGVVGTLSVFGGLRWGNLVVPATAQTDNPATADSNASSDSDGSSSATNEGTPTGLPGYTVGQIYLRYEEHVGITTFIEVENEAAQNNERVQLKADAYSPDETLGTDERWKDVPATFERRLKLRLGNVFDLYNAVDNISEFVIRGRVADGEYAVLATFSGSALRAGIENDGPATPDGGADAAVEVRPETTDTGETDQTGGSQPADGNDETTDTTSEPTTDETATEEATDTAGDETPTPGNQTGVDVSNPDDVVDVGTGGDNGGDNGSGGGLLESLSFGLFGG